MTSYIVGGQCIYDIKPATVIINNMKKFSLITKQGTAISETTLCEVHFTDTYKNHCLYVISSKKELRDMIFEDISLNDECSCIICGHN